MPPLSHKKLDGVVVKQDPGTVNSVKGNDCLHFSVDLFYPWGLGIIFPFL